MMRTTWLLAGGMLLGWLVAAAQADDAKGTEVTLDGLKSRVPVIFLTGKLDEVDEVLALKLGADDFVRKPFSQRVLAERVRTVLRRVRSLDPATTAELLGQPTFRYPSYQLPYFDIAGKPTGFFRVRFLTDILKTASRGRAKPIRYGQPPNSAPQTPTRIDGLRPS